MSLAWPESLVAAVRGLKSVFAFFSRHRLAGVPLDLPLRFVVMAAGQVWLRRRLGPRQAVLACTAVLLAKEVFDVFAVRDPVHPKSPNWGDVADVVSGLAGIAAAETLIRLRRRALNRRSGARGG